MPKDKKIKDAIRARMATTGESYMKARPHVLAAEDDTTPAKIRKVLLAHPDLGYFGYLCPGDDREKFEEARRWLLGAPGHSEVECCMAYLALIGKNASARRGVGSYHLKHRVESWLIQRGRGGYVSNGAFIVAALISAAPVRRDAGTPNCIVGLKLKDVEATSPYLG